MTALFVAVAGGLGALGRYELASMVARRSPGAFPYGTLAVNALGAFLTGLAATRLSGTGADLVVSGFLGGFTTFSTWMVETARLAERGSRWGLATLNLVLMLAAGLVAAVAGRAIG